MQSSSFHYLPPFFGILVLLFALVIAILQIGILGYAYEKMGIGRLAAYAILFFSLAGASINIPLAEVAPEPVVATQEVVDHWGIRYLVPVYKQFPRTVIAINVGATGDTNDVSRSMLGLMGQTVDVMMQANTRAAMQSADIVINPAVKAFGSLDWRRSVPSLRSPGRPGGR